MPLCRLVKLEKARLVSWDEKRIKALADNFLLEGYFEPKGWFVCSMEEPGSPIVYVIDDIRVGNLAGQNCMKKVKERLQEHACMISTIRCSILRMATIDSLPRWVLFNLVRNPTPFFVHSFLHSLYQQKISIYCFVKLKPMKMMDFFKRAAFKRG